MEAGKTFTGLFRILLRHTVPVFSGTKTGWFLLCRQTVF
jgi:hypothetical protein